MSALSSLLIDLSYSVTNCFSCFPSSPQLKINNRRFKILRLLGEGGFSYVYLVSDTSNDALYALKKIRCPFGQESVSLALKEVEAYKLFAPHPNIIHSIDHSVEKDKSDPSANTVYILLPYYRRGNLQDLINANLVNHTKFPERKLLELFLGVCVGLKAMHQYKVKGGAGAAKPRKGASAADDAPSQKTNGHGADDDSDVEQPLMENEVTISQEGVAPGGDRAYSHRDIKPGNIMVDDDGTTPIVMDLGSLAPSPTAVTSRSLALALQDTAAEHSTMPYRAPELFDVKTGSVVDTKVDIWSLGCTLYACLVGKSPFEARSEETGGSLSLCVLGGDWRFPDEAPQRGKQKNAAPAEAGVSEAVKEVVRRCLRVEPNERPDVDELIEMVKKVIQTLPEEVE